MDATMIDITDLQGVQAGDEVVLLGKQGNEEITAMELADWAGTVTYQVLSGWTKRLDRIYL
jgi:alanine racemase